MESDQLCPWGSVFKLGILSNPIFYFIEYVSFQVFSNRYEDPLMRI